MNGGGGGNLRITGGRVIDPANRRDEVCDVLVRDGKIAAVGDAGDATNATADTHDTDNTTTTINATNLLILPGLIDLCARLHQPGHAQTDLATETHAAAAGGITRLICPPDSAPVIDTAAVARMVQDRAAAAGFTRVHPLGALTAALGGERLADMASLMDAGCVGVSNALAAIDNTLVMRRAMQYAASFDLPVFITPHDRWLGGNGVAHEGEVSTRLGLPAIPEAAETVGVARDLALIETSGARAHFALISSARAVEMLREAHARALPVSAGVSIHHLLLNERHIGTFDTRYKVFPPLRTRRDQLALLAGVQDGTLSAICSDHQPHQADAKLAPFTEAAAGISGVETLLTLVWQLVEAGSLPAHTAIQSLTTNPANILGLAAGHLGIGARADICLFDPKLEWTPTPKTLTSTGKNTPWNSNPLPGKVVATVIDGTVVFTDNPAT